MRTIKHPDLIVSFKGQELAIKLELAQLSSFLRSQIDCIQDEIIDLDHLLSRAESTNSLGIRKAISCEEVAMVFVLVDKIYTTLTPRSDGGYVAQQVQLAVDYAFINHDNAFLGNVCRIAHVLGIPFLVNACASTIMARPGIVDWIVDLENMDDLYIPADYDLIARQLFEKDFGWFGEKDFGWLAQNPILKLLKKHFLLKKNDFSELSIADYLHIYGQPEVSDYSTLSFNNKKITSLYGIDQISYTSDIEQLDLGNNFLAASWYDMDTVISFSQFTGLLTMYLQNNYITELPLEIFDGLDSLIALNLSKNLLMNLELRHFQYLDNLEFLWLCNNNIEKLPDRIFANRILRKLKKKEKSYEM